ncbi:MAG TPA: dienelactone hydrolase family protein [Chloroflexota bacterium]
MSEISFGDGLRGHLFVPAGVGRAGAVVILHERYGLVKHTLDLAEKLARDGYVALAPDLFSRWQGDKEALKRGDVRATLPDEEIAAVVNGGLDFLKAHERVDGSKLAVMGVCQSGRYPIVVGSQRPDLAALVVFYGAAQESDWQLSELQPKPMPDMIARTTAPGLYVFGEADHVISIDEVLRLKSTIEQARKSSRMKVVPKMPHGWLNDTMPGRYRSKEAEEAWQLLVGFLDETFSGRWPPAGRVIWEFQSDIGQDYDFSKNVRLE